MTIDLKVSLRVFMIMLIITSEYIRVNNYFDITTYLNLHALYLIVSYICVISSNIKGTKQKNLLVSKIS